MKSLNQTFILLMILTIFTIILTYISIDSSVKMFLIILLFSAKFLLVAFYFMELKLANSFWKIALTAFLVVINSIVVLLLV